MALGAFRSKKLKAQKARCLQVMSEVRVFNKILDNFFLKFIVTHRKNNKKEISASLLNFVRLDPVRVGWMNAREHRGPNCKEKNDFRMRQNDFRV